MNNKNNSGNESESKTNEAQEEINSELQKNRDIVLAVGQGKTSNQLTQYIVNYSTLTARIKAFDVIETPYIDEISVSGEITKLLPEKALKHSYRLGKEKAEWFIAGCFEPAIRKTDNLKYRSAIVLDLDSYDGDISELEAFIKAELAEYTYIAYSTANHTPNKPKVRIFLPTTENIATEDYKQISSQFVNSLSFKTAVDAASFKPNQFMFFSSQINITGLPEGVEQPEYHKWVIENKAVLLEPDKFKKANTSNTEAITSKHVETANSMQSKSINVSQKQVTESLEEYKASGLSYDEWREVLMAIHHYYKGSEEGLAIADNWSKQDADKYQSFEEIKYKWQSFGNQTGDAQVTFLTILKRITDRKRVKFEQEIVQRIEELTTKVSKKTFIPIMQAIAEFCSNEEAEYYLDKIKARTSLGISVLRSKLSSERRRLEAINFKKSGKSKAVYPLKNKLPPMIFEEEYQEMSLPKCTIENFKKLIDAYGIKIVRNVVSK